VTSRDRTVLGVVGLIAALAAFWFLALGPKRKDAAAIGDKLSAAQVRLDAARTEATASQAARTRYAVSYSNVARLGKAVPADDDVPSLVYQLDSTAKATGVDFRSIKVASGSGTTPPPAANAAQASAATSDQAGKSGQKTDPSKAGSTTTTTPVGASAPAQATTATLPPGATVGTAGFATMPFSFEFTGSFFKLADFFGHVERYIRASAKRVDVTGRLLMIDGISLKASPTGFPSMSASVSATTYLLPQSEGVTAGATPSGPAAGTQNVNAGTTTTPPVVPATATGVKP
jgi:Tfp pilus assembly protein PilO